MQTGDGEQQEGQTQGDNKGKEESASGFSVTVGTGQKAGKKQ